MITLLIWFSNLCQPYILLYCLSTAVCLLLGLLLVIIFIFYLSGK